MVLSEVLGLLKCLDFNIQCKVKRETWRVSVHARKRMFQSVCLQDMYD